MDNTSDLDTDAPYSEVPRFDSLMDAINALSTDAHHPIIKSLDEVDLRPVSGGDINQASVLTLPNSKADLSQVADNNDQTVQNQSQNPQVFLKQNTLNNAPLLFAEVDGLCAIAATGARTCRPLAYGVDNKIGRSFLLLSMIQPYQGSRSDKDAGWYDLAKQLATLHKAVPPQPDKASINSDSVEDENKQTATWYAGWFSDNYIGSNPQRNQWTENWYEFFATQRLGEQTKLAFDNHRISRQILRQLENLQQKLSLYLPDYPLTDDGGQPRPSLLHGDLWAGNAMLGQADDYIGKDKAQQAVGYLIDPAVYVGHPETDLAMTQLFGGFSESFYEAYVAYGLTEDGFADRVDIYNLYHYLNHLNLFGSGYLNAVEHIAKRYG
ncbi:fructosamine kinase family protein [Psychrobacter sp. FDAARGOS_221]|uniref:fructosamine kinase family protein n=1 Tax=Psychrobacter sp. FDAARGOS_221 TaxID=1975705 RepID=UPI00187D1BB3|nr:fructosamine kinase family protein [Psychrobacter sp. FDAARGOS_221]